MVFSVLAVVKFHASWRSSRSTPAASSASNAVLHRVAPRLDRVDVGGQPIAVRARTRATRRSARRRWCADPAGRRRRCVSGARLIAGWITRSRSVGSSAPASGSAHSGTRSPVEVSTSTTVASSSSDAPRSVHVRQVRRVEVGDVGEQRGVGAEAVFAVPRRRVDRDALRIGRKRRSRERHSMAARRRSVVDEVGVAREREHALARVERITTRRVRTRRLPRSPPRSRRRPEWTEPRSWSVCAGAPVVAAGLSVAATESAVVVDRLDSVLVVDGVVSAPAARCDDQRRGDAESPSYPHATHRSQPSIRRCGPAKLPMGRQRRYRPVT